MTNHVFQLHWANSFAGLALLFLFSSFMLPGTSSAQKSQAKLDSSTLSLSPKFLKQTNQIRSRTKTIDAILGVSIGMSLEEVRARLTPLGKSDGRTTREGGRKEVWALNKTQYASIALKTNAAGQVVWVTGFVRPGEEVPFTEVGDLALAQNITESQAIWNMAHPNGGYRLVAKGPHRKASVVYLLSLAGKPPE